MDLNALSREELQATLNAIARRFIVVPPCERIEFVEAVCLEVGRALPAHRGALLVPQSPNETPGSTEVRVATVYAGDEFWPIFTTKPRPIDVKAAITAAHLRGDPISMWVGRVFTLPDNAAAFAEHLAEVLDEGMAYEVHYERKAAVLSVIFNRGPHLSATTFHIHVQEGECPRCTDESAGMLICGKCGAALD